MQDVKTTARFAGLLSLLTVLGGVFAQGYIARRLIHFGDAAATASNIVGHPDMLRLGFAVYMVEMACDIAKTALFYELLKPVNGSLSLVAAFLGLTGCVIKALSRVFFVAPLLLLGGGAPYLGVFSPEQLQALSLVFLRINDRGAGTATIFYGLSAPITGYLMLRSAFLPRFLGVLEIVCGVGWLTFLYPPLYSRLFPLVVGLALLGSAVLIFWLLVFGVDEEKWREQASTA
jgi:uncharacterized protein DUF4386